MACTCPPALHRRAALLLLYLLCMLALWSGADIQPAGQAKYLTTLLTNLHKHVASACFPPHGGCTPASAKHQLKFDLHGAADADILVAVQSLLAQVQRAHSANSKLASLMNVGVRKQQQQDPAPPQTGGKS